MNNPFATACRNVLRRYEALLLLAGILLGTASAAQEQEILEIPDAAIAAMDVDKAMNLVSAKMGHYWLRSLRGTCTFELPGGERGVNNYGIMLYNLAGVTFSGDGPGVGTVFFNYAPVPDTYCRIPFLAASRQEAMELATSFRKLSRETREAMQARIDARYAIDVTSANSMERFLKTDVSIEIAKVLLQQHMRSLVRPGGAGEHIAGPPPLSAGSEYIAAATYVLETGEPDTKIDSDFRLLAASNGDFEVQKRRAGRLNVCRDSSFYRAMTHEGARECRSEGNDVTTTSFSVMEGQASFLPANINTIGFYAVDAEHATVLEDGRSFATRSRYVRACYAVALESIAVPAGAFDTVRFLCGSVQAQSYDHEKQFGTIWVDRNTGLPVKSEMQVHSMDRSQRYVLNESVTSLIRSP